MSMLIFSTGIDFLLYFPECVTHKYTITSIRILSWLHDPNIFGNVYVVQFLLINFLLWVILIISFFCQMFLLFLLKLLLFYHLLLFYLIKILLELFILRIINTMFNVESKRKYFKRILALERVELWHVKK